MFPLGALIAGDPAGGYQAARLKGQQIDQGDLASAGEKAYGQTLPLLFSGQVPGAQPMGGPPPQAPQMGGQQNPLQAIIQRLMGGMQGGQPPQGQPGMPSPGGPPQPSSVPGAQPMNPGAPPGSGMFPTAAQGGNPPGQPPMGQQPSPMPGQGQSPQTLDWRTIVQKVVQANPGNKDPRVIGAAVDRFMPLMNQQSQQQWREISNMMKERALESRERIVGQQIEGRQGVAETQAASREGIAADAEAGRQSRAELSASTRSEIAKLSDAAKREIATATEAGREGRFERGTTSREGIAERAEAGREGRAAQSEAGRQGRFDTREGRLSHQATVREDQSWQRLQLQRDNLSRQIEQGGNRQLLGQWRAILDAQHKRAQEIISSQQAGMGGAERKKLLAEEDAFYNEQIKTMKSQMEGGAKPAQPSSEAPAAQEHVNPQTGQVIILKDGAWVDKATGKPIGAGPKTMTDEQPDPVRPGQRTAMMDNPRASRPKPQLADQFGGPGRAGEGGVSKGPEYERAQRIPEMLSKGRTPEQIVKELKLPNSGRPGGAKENLIIEMSKNGMPIDKIFELFEGK